MPLNDLITLVTLALAVLLVTPFLGRYVQRVMENLQVYRTRLDERSTLLIERDLRRGVLR